MRKNNPTHKEKRKKNLPTKNGRKNPNDKERKKRTY